MDRLWDWQTGNKLSQIVNKNLQSSGYVSMPHEPIGPPNLRAFKGSLMQCLFLKFSLPKMLKTAYTTHRNRWLVTRFKETRWIGIQADTKCCCGPSPWSGSHIAVYSITNTRLRVLIRWMASLVWCLGSTSARIRLPISWIWFSRGEAEDINFRRGGRLSFGWW